MSFPKIAALLAALSGALACGGDGPTGPDGSTRWVTASGTSEFGGWTEARAVDREGSDLIVRCFVDRNVLGVYLEPHFATSSPAPVRWTVAGTPEERNNWPHSNALPFLLYGGDDRALARRMAGAPRIVFGVRGFDGAERISEFDGLGLVGPLAHLEAACPAEEG